MFFLLNLPKVNFVILMGFNNLILVAETKYFRASLADTGGRAKHQNDGISMTTPADAPKQHNTDFDKAYNQHLFGLILAVLLRQGSANTPSGLRVPWPSLYETCKKE
ncbi:hypothetical protein F2Q70_00015602 [Brassica cretica]|uniref:Uncharacterized protein n=1 Tax=Brassica cretica TaxID=69181 RepID=A0A3N6PU27_BRACR|nr:hypothetical protein F2Q70_00015602 [Brassica cretica]